MVELNRAVAIAMADGPDAGLRLLDPLAEDLDRYHLFHAARADLLRRAGDAAPRPAEPTAGRSSWSRNDAERRYLERRRAALATPRPFTPFVSSRGLASGAAMLFPTVDFALFFCLVFLGHWVLNHNARAWKWFMIGASYFFYGWWNPRYVAPARWASP